MKINDDHDARTGPQTGSSPVTESIGAGPGPDMNTAPEPRGRIDPDSSKKWLRRMSPVLGARKAGFVFALGATLLGGLVSASTPRVVMAAIDSLDRGAAHRLTPFVIGLLGLAVLRALFGFASRYGMFAVATNIDYDLRAHVYEHLSRLSFSFYDRVQTGQLISRANSDIRSVQMFLAFAPMLTVSLLSFLVAVVLMVQIHIPLTLVAVAPIPFVFWYGVRMRKLLFPISWIVQARLADITTIVEENVTGVRIVKSFAAEADQIRKLVASARRLRWASVLQVDIRARYAPLLENLPRLGLVSVLLFGGWLAIQGQVTVGAIIAFSAYVVMLQAPFRMIGFLLMLGQRARASAGRIFEIVDEHPEITDRPGALHLRECRGEVGFHDVTFGYGDDPAILDGLNLHLAPGETVALVGRTGSGKSTLARLLMRFYEVRSGSVTLDGHDIRDISQANLRSHVGVVLDDAFLFSDSIHDNIAYARPAASRADVEAAARAAGADVFIQDLPDGYDTVVGKRGYTLSGGQRQRIAIARTLLANPRVLILDDATSSVDVRTEEQIHGALRHLMQGRTTLIIAHRLSTISLAQRVVLLEDGRIVASGVHADLLRTEPRYAEVLAHAEEEWAAAHRPRKSAPDLRPRAGAEPVPIDLDLGGFGR